MEDLYQVLLDIKFELEKMNDKLDDVKGNGLYDSISDLNDKLEEIQGDGLFNSISDVNEKLDDVVNSLSSIDFNTM